MGNQLDEFSFQALVSLNNTGAILIQRNRFEEAYTTFMDALSVLECGPTIETEDDMETFHSSLRVMVNWARMRLDATSEEPAHLTLPQSTFTAMETTTSHNSRATQCFGVNPGISAAYLDLRVLQQESVYLNHQCLQANEIHFDLASAAVVYNFGICHLKMAIFKATEQDYFRQSGLSLMKYAYAALPPTPPFTEIDDFMSIATMSIIILSFLVEVGSLSEEELFSFRQQLRLAQEGLSIFAAQPRTAAAA